MRCGRTDERTPRNYKRNQRDPTGAKMDFSLNDEQVLVQSSARDLLSAHWSRERRREYVGNAPNGSDQDLWDILNKSGFVSMLAPDRLGGADAPFPNVMPVLEEIGRALAPSTLMTSSVVGMTALRWAADQGASTPMLADVASGAARICVADCGTGSTKKREAALTLEGSFTAVPDLAEAGFAIVCLSEYVLVVPLSSGDAGIEVTPTRMLDPTRRIGHLRLKNVAVPTDHVLAEGLMATHLSERLTDLRRLVGTCDALGGSRAALDMAVQYAKDRVQFGRPIGSFQALQHVLADAYVDIENLRSCVWHACWCWETGAEALEFALMAAHAMASRVYSDVADLNVQIHGGMGFTREVDAYLYAARAKVGEVTGGARQRSLAMIGNWLRNSDPDALVEYLGGAPRHAATVKGAKDAEQGRAS